MGKRKHADAIDMTGPSPPSARENEVINLAEDTPTPPGKRRQMAEVLQQLNIPPDSSLDSQQRRAIMAHAALVNLSSKAKAVAAKGNGNPFVAAQAAIAYDQSHEEDTDQTDSDSEAAGAAAAAAAAAATDAADMAAKQAIMQHAAGLSQNNSLLAQLHAERLARQQLASPSRSQQSADAQQRQGHPQSSNATASSTTSPQFTELKLLTYNVWFQEEVALEARMQGIGKVIAQEGFPNFICFQEVTHNIHALFQQSHWWVRYTASPAPEVAYFTLLLYRKDVFQPKSNFKHMPFNGSVMGRTLLSISGVVQNQQILVATSHLESPCGQQGMYINQRKGQLKQGFIALTEANQPNTLWAGDMNCIREDGPVKLPPEWIDAWPCLYPRDAGYTYDGRKNFMLGPTNNLQGRLDRVFYRARHLQLKSIKMVGTHAIPDVSYLKPMKKRALELPVLPSDHYGLLASWSINASN